MKLAFFGTSQFAVPALKALHEAGHEICAVVTMPDQKAGREMQLTPPPIKLAAQELELEIFQPETLKSEEFFEKFSSWDCHMAVVAAYGNIIPEKYLDAMKYGFLNIHPSLLPRHRGPSPIQTSIMQGDEVLGVTIMKLDKGMDTGPLLAQIKFHPAPNETFVEIHDKLAALGAELLVETIPEYITEHIEPAEQNDSEATITKMITRADGHIDWSRSPHEVYNLIRALNPEPGTWTTWREKTLAIKKAALDSSGNLQIISLQLEGKKETPFKDFLNGYPDFKLEDCK